MKSTDDAQEARGIAPTIIDLDPESIFGSDQKCFGCGPKNEKGWRLKFQRVDDEVHTKFTPTSGHDGPPGILHGGLQSTLLDEIGAWTLVGILNRMGFTTSMRVRFLRSARLGMPLQAVGKVFKQSEKIVTVNARITQKGETISTAKISYILVDKKQAEEILGSLPPSWEHLFS